MCQNPLKSIAYIFVSLIKYMANGIYFNYVIMTNWIVFKSQVAIITVVLSICDFDIQSYHNRK